MFGRTRQMPEVTSYIQELGKEIERLDQRSNHAASELMQVFYLWKNQNELVTEDFGRAGVFRSVLANEGWPFEVRPSKMRDDRLLTEVLRTVYNYLHAYGEQNLYLMQVRGKVPVLLARR
jgi:hypothetical protein